jgi:hypothetical protein
MGIIQVLTDPRTSMAQCLQAILTAELTDNAGLGGKRAGLKIKDQGENTMSTTMGQTGSNMSQMGQHSEGTVARTIEQQTAKLPSDVFLWAAVGSMGASALLRLMGKKHASLFVGDWVAPMMLFGVYNKIVKTQGSDRGH